MWNLLDNGWLPARGVGDASHRGDGVGQVGVRRLLMEAHLFEGLAVDLPTQLPAIFRQVLLPIVADALGLPADAAAWAQMFRTGSFSPQQRQTLAAYLDEHHGRFELFDPVQPFAQVAGLRTANGETKGSALLVATAATGNNVPLFSPRSEGDPLQLTPAQAARWLLHTHCWDTAAIKTGAVGDPQVKGGKTTGNPTGPLGRLGVVMPLGRTVFDTLLLNIPFGQRILPDDLPQWRRRATEGSIEQTRSCATPVWQARASHGLLDLWTWQSRRIRLIPEQTPAGLRVTRVVVAAGDRLAATPDDEPHTTWIVDTAASRAKKTVKSGKSAAAAVPRPHRHQPGKAAWRGLEALLAVDRAGEEPAAATRSGFYSSGLLRRLGEVRERMPQTYPLQLQLCGITYGNQSAVIEDVYSDELPLPLAALAPDGIVRGALSEAIDQAEQLAEAVNRLSAELRRAAGAEPIPFDKGHRPGETLLHALDPLVRRLLTGLRAAGEDPELSERGLTAWEALARRETWKLAEQVLSAAAPSTFTGRQVSKDGREQAYRLSTAEAHFRKRLEAILTRRAEPEQPPVSPETAARTPPPSADARFGPRAAT